ncbi:MAG: galactokinase, partial [Chitinophagaceae bacterium]
MNDHYHKIQSIFATHFPQKPALYFSPGRINLIGEHIDYNDGYVLPAAIDKGVYFAIAPNDTRQINFYAADFDEHFSVDGSAIKKDEGWKNYLLSVINEFQA